MVRPSRPSCFLATLSSTLLLLSSASTHDCNPTASQCTRSFLKSISSLYITAQSLGESSAFITSLLSPAGNLTNPGSNLTWTNSGPYANITAPSFLYKENEIVLSPTSANSTLSVPIKIDFHRSAHDTRRCASFTELIAASNPGHPYVIHTRMEFSPSTLQPVMIESVVTDEGDWLFNATGTLSLARQEDWPIIPLNSSARNSYEEIQALGDAYFNRFGNANVTVPWGPPCIRIEGGLPARGNLTASGECIQEWPSTIIVPWRRYVVDEEVGVVDMFVGFPGLDRSQGETPMPDSHVFRVEAGRIKYLHTASSCVEKECGLNGTFFGSEEGMGQRSVGKRSVRRGKAWRLGKW
ncbi:hypothetical protein B0T20DRAFT_349813 [Sordaria brevicollis]|uniref:DUF8021 domain-containing protein n=1 Tax=Sordaria brevicollis TaxID=83679 RepID=A0AAE0PGV8_SORBR|nr:hypothetical protein B0T20DRAFT_349813 [Sordaria brevicollis]